MLSFIVVQHERERPEEAAEHHSSTEHLSCHTAVRLSWSDCPS